MPSKFKSDKPTTTLDRTIGASQRDDDVLAFPEIDPAGLRLVGGKAAHLAALSRIEGLRVPPGFCVTTIAFERFLANAPSLDDALERLSRLAPDDRDAIRPLSAALRHTLEQAPIPDDLAAAMTRALATLGEETACAVRSSATAEDLPTASFAGQQDTYLNIVGPPSILDHVRRCWASLFTERAVTYRLRNGFDPRKVHMAVVVQQMVFPEAAGILFTADPITGNRKVTSIEASFGLGEALVSGLVNADVYKVRGDVVVAKTISTKRLAIQPLPAGGTEERPIAPEQQARPALTDPQAVQLAHLGRRIEAHFGQPQDIEWCLAGGVLHIVQSRPITTLFPVPETTDGANHVYLSVGHQQMMTDPMKPLGLSMWQLMTRRPMAEAGGRLFVDVTQQLSSPAGREGLFQMAGKSDPLTRDALQTVLDRGDFITELPEGRPGTAPAPAASPPPLIEADPALPAGLIALSQASIAALKREIAPKTGASLFDFLVADIQELQRLLFEPRSMQLIMAGVEATWWLNEHLEAWLGEKSAADTLAQSVDDNVTSAMGLALLDVADVIRPHPEVVGFLEHALDDGFLDDLSSLAGGRAAREAIQAWLDTYGMRGVGEIDITRPRWSERPATLLPLILGNVRNFKPGAAARRFEQGRQASVNQEQELLKRLRALPEGEQKAAETKRRVDQIRAFAGYREYPKYAKICREFVCRQALLAEAERLVLAGVLRAVEDIFFLRFEELHDMVRANAMSPAHDELLRGRKDAFRHHQALTPPRVLTSDGECLSGSFRRDDVPFGALVGLAVSGGTVEGRARVIHDLAKANIEPGDILVTAFTDPSWTPLFVAIEGLVTEVGGLMTHGAVIAREYGLPAVVAVHDATRRIRDGQRIRVNGTDGYLEILS